jgi:DNA-binding response OmpR family regulator
VLYRQLHERNVDVVLTDDAADGLVQAGVLRPDVVLTAAQVPPMRSPAIVRAVFARTGIPTLVGIDRKDDGAAQEAAASGAAGCVHRPYRTPEVLGLLRELSPHSPADEPVLAVGELVLDPGAYEVRLRGRRIDMPPREFDLLHLLMSHPGRVLTRPQIYRLVWSSHAESSNTLSVHIKRLRARLGDDPARPRIIVGLRGLGYRLDPPP